MDNNYYLTDEQGSVRYVLDAAGNVQNDYQYDAFGQRIAGQENIPNRLRYNAQIEDDLTGLYNLRARYYNTGIGRFTQEDVIYNDGLNLYAYCSSNPVMYADPSGYSAWDDFRKQNKGKYNREELSLAYAKSGLKSKKKYSDRQTYMGNTPSKKSSVGETVISNMEKWGNAPTDYIIRDSKGKAVMFKSLKDGGGIVLKKQI